MIINSYQASDVIWFYSFACVYCSLLLLDVFFERKHQKTESQSSWFSPLCFEAAQASSSIITFIRSSLPPPHLPVRQQNNNNFVPDLHFYFTKQRRLETSFRSLLSNPLSIHSPSSGDNAWLKFKKKSAGEKHTFTTQTNTWDRIGILRTKRKEREKSGSSDSSCSHDVWFPSWFCESLFCNHIFLWIITYVSLTVSDLLSFRFPPTNGHPSFLLCSLVSFQAQNPRQTNPISAASNHLFLLSVSRRSAKREWVKAAFKLSGIRFFGRQNAVFFFLCLLPYICTMDTQFRNPQSVVNICCLFLDGKWWHWFRVFCSPSFLLPSLLWTTNCPGILFFPHPSSSSLPYFASLFASAAAKERRQAMKYGEGKDVKGEKGGFLQNICTRKVLLV